MSETPSLFIVEGSAGMWHFHLSLTGKNGDPSLCGNREVMLTHSPLKQWGFKPRHYPSSYCQQCEGIALDMGARLGPRSK